MATTDLLLSSLHPADHQDAAVSLPDDAGLELSIVIPCLNEAETLGTCIQKAQQWLRKHGVRGEVIVGDNGSTDGSQEIARCFGARVIEVPIRGYGAALYHATRAAQGRYVIMGDADDSYDFSDLLPFLEKLRQGFDLVVGNRFKGGIKPGAMPWKNRYIGNPVLTGIGRVFFGSASGDFHCGLRGFSAQAFRAMDLRTTGMEYASEMVIKATLMRLRIAEVPTTLSRDGRSRPPHLRPWRDGWRHLRFMLLYSPRWLFLYPGIAFMLAGLAVSAWLWPGPRALGHVVFDVHTLVYAAAAVLIGFQSVLFACLSKTFAVTEGLLPADPKFTRLFRYLNLETGLLAGALLVVLGLGGSLAMVWFWSTRSFGELDSTTTLRFVIPSVLSLALGCQTILSSFFFSLLGLRVRGLEGKR
jgi:glycosyltransferase involved in cell wall biosynthesis